MKKIVLAFLVLYGNLLYSQSSNSTEVVRVENSTLYNVQVLRTGNFSRVVNQRKDIKGSIHLFENWNNNVLIRTNNNKLFTIKNFNFNIKDNNFESKIGNDSIFIFDLRNIDFVEINSKKFKKIYSPKDQEDKVFEVIFEGEPFSLIKEYNSILKINDPDPLMFRKNFDEYRIRSVYYLKEGNYMDKFKLNKKNILKLMKNKSSKVADYANDKGLSFKNDEDLNKIFKYYGSL